MRLKSNKVNFIFGFFGAPLIPILVALVDYSILGGEILNKLIPMCESLGLKISEDGYNFYNYSVNRLLGFGALLISPVMVCFWYFTADATKFSTNERRERIRTLSIFSVTITLIWLAMLFMPFATDYAPTRNQRLFITMHKSPIAFIFPLYYMLFGICFVVGYSLRYFTYNRRFLNGQ